MAMVEIQTPSSEHDASDPFVKAAEGWWRLYVDFENSLEQVDLPSEQKALLQERYREKVRPLFELGLEIAQNNVIDAANLSLSLPEVHKILSQYQLLNPTEESALLVYSYNERHRDGNAASYIRERLRNKIQPLFSMIDQSCLQIPLVDESSPLWQAVDAVRLKLSWLKECQSRIIEESRIACKDILTLK